MVQCATRLRSRMLYHPLWTAHGPARAAGLRRSARRGAPINGAAHATPTDDTALHSNQTAIAHHLIRGSLHAGSRSEYPATHRAHRAGECCARLSELPLANHGRSIAHLLHGLSKLTASG